MRNRCTQPQAGFTVFFAMLVATLALSVGVVIYDLLVRNLALSQVASQSQYAIYAADTGVECALYWDLKFNSLNATDQDQSAFATSSLEIASDVGNSGMAITCNGQNIAAASTISGFKNTVGNNNAGWDISQIGTTYATTTFWISLGTTSKDPCAKVEIGKSGNPPQTTLVSHGYNTCLSGATLRVERTLQVSY